MKFIKKVAALCFCAALALSVMAVSASADFTDPQFSLTVTKIDSRTDINSDGNNVPDYKGSDTVSYKITLTKEASGSFTVNALQFTLTTTDASSVIGAPVVTINGQTITPTGNVYQYLKEYNGGTTIYAFTDETTSFDVGTITYTTTAPTGDGVTSAIGSFAITAASAHQTSLNDPNAWTVTTSSVGGSAEVHRDYSITVLTPEFCGASDSTPYVKKTTTAVGADLGSEVDNPVAYNIVDGATVPNLDDQTGANSVVTYTFDGWAISGSGHNWGSANIDKEDSDYTFTNGKYGDVTLTAIYTPKNYTATFVYDKPDGTNADNGSDTYNIEDTVTIADPTCDGYTFKGWKVTTGAGSWSDTDANQYAMATDADVGTTAFAANQYGAVVFTAQWEINGIFKQVAYAFAQNGSKLTLFAVKTSEGATGNKANTAASSGCYAYDSTYTMYTAAKYVALFTEDEIAENDRENWTIYATIAPESEAASTKIAFTANTTANTAVAFNDGNVNDIDGKDIGDYGTAGAILAANTTYTGISILSRLKMDMNDNDLASALGDIHDLKAIMDATLAS